MPLFLTLIQKTLEGMSPCYAKFVLFCLPMSSNIAQCSSVNTYRGTLRDVALVVFGDVSVNTCRATLCDVAKNLPLITCYRTPGSCSCNCATNCEDLQKG